MAALNFNWIDLYRYVPPRGKNALIDQRALHSLAVDGAIVLAKAWVQRLLGRATLDATTNRNRWPVVAVLGETASAAARNGAADSTVSGKRAGPDGWLARSKRKQVIATVKVMCVPRRLRKLSQPWRKLCQNAGICTRCRIGFHAREACPHANEIDRLMADIKGKAPNSKALGKG